MTCVHDRNTYDCPECVADIIAKGKAMRAKAIRTQAIDDCIKVAQTAASELGKFHGPSKPRSEIYRAEGANIVAYRLQALKEVK